MIYVTMKDGRTFRYNRCNRYTVNGDWISLNIKDDGHIARIAACDVARVEFEKPCAIAKNGKYVKVDY